MPLKFTKDISTHLFKYVRRVDIRFNPFDSRTTSARELLRQVQASRLKAANPKLEIDAKVLNSAEAPSAVFKFVDDSQIDFDSENYDTKEILHSVYLKAMQLNTEYEMDGKNIDDII
mmetsp:Transcript_2944/g.4785  ORF Transcript_2944/g.4785 Transcript_2944/m.4785 type:complete len:117 (-) Transcript_2944:64-414(-)|eukprot:CAMPEP_0119008806 /NCGR_PEP_ID=MMETSP1176-20130426/3955_1 /TAXON_ID=265551 /ORGANISM="Synedropsis recta cf, Strain CCMP1620" /LENGTH=116 /DNA_ID=CAMNT_0006961209 /DNA_START=61 /DNA_END=411 /DNA_ORIENTATION=-